MTGDDDISFYITHNGCVVLIIAVTTEVFSEDVLVRR
jgi:hypothetical protein